MNTLATVNQNETSIQDFFATLFERWIAFFDGKQKTVETYARNIKPFMAFLLDNGITRPQREDIIKYREFIRAGRKATTVNAYLMAVKQFFNWTEQAGLYPNISSKVKALKVGKGYKKDYLTKEQAAALLSNIDTSDLKGLRDYAILALMVTTGLRTIEIARANIEDLRPAGNAMALYIQAKIYDDRETEYVKLAAPVEKAIRAYLRARGQHKDGDPLFASIAHRNGGERMTTRSISRIAKENLINADLISSRLTAHSLRHTAGTLNLLSGGTIEETQQLLRHSNINTTMMYVHILDRVKNESENRIAGAIFNL